MKKFVGILSLCFGTLAHAAGIGQAISVDMSGKLTSPTNFFHANTNELVDSILGFLTPGTFIDGTNILEFNPAPGAPVVATNSAPIYGAYGGGARTRVNTVSGDGTLSPILTEYDGAIRLATLDALRAYAGNGTSVFVTDTNRGGMFTYTATAHTTNAGTIYEAVGKGSGTWVRQFEGGVYPEWFGAVPMKWAGWSVYPTYDASVDSTAAIQAAIDHTTYPLIRLRASTVYYVTNLVVIPNTTIIGDHPWSSMLYAFGDNTGTMITDNGSAVRLNLRDFVVWGNNSSQNGIRVGYGTPLGSGAYWDNMNFGGFAINMDVCGNAAFFNLVQCGEASTAVTPQPFNMIISGNDSTFQNLVVNSTNSSVMLWLTNSSANHFDWAHLEGGAQNPLVITNGGQNTFHRLDYSVNHAANPVASNIIEFVNCVGNQIDAYTPLGAYSSTPSWLVKDSSSRTRIPNSSLTVGSINQAGRSPMSTFYTNASWSMGNQRMYDTVVFTNLSTAATLTLPAANAVPGLRVTIINGDTNYGVAIVIGGASWPGTPYYAVYQGASVTVQADSSGLAWRTISSTQPFCNDYREFAISTWSTNLPVNNTVLKLNPSANFTNYATGLPNVNAAKLSILTADRSEANYITFQDVGRVGSSNMRLREDTRSIIGGTTLVMFYDGTDWQEIGWHGPNYYTRYSETPYIPVAIGSTGTVFTVTGVDAVTRIAAMDDDGSYGAVLHGAPHAGASPVTISSNTPVMWVNTGTTPLYTPALQYQFAGTNYFAHLSTNETQPYVSKAGDTMTGSLIISNAATSTFTLTATNWNDSMAPALSFRNGSSAPTLGDGPDSGVKVLLFAKDAGNLAHGSIQLPHDYKEGTDIYPHLHLWFPAYAASGAETNVWKLTYSWGNISTNGFPASASISVTNTGVIQPNEHRIVSFGAISGAGKKISSCILVTVERTGTDGHDVYDDNIGFVSADAHYQQDTIGSASETAK